MIRPNSVDLPLHPIEAEVAPGAAPRQRLRPALTRWLQAAKQGGSGPMARKGVLALFDQGVVSGTSFVTLIIIGRNCRPDELGTFTLGLSIVLFAMCIQSALITAPYTVWGNRLEDAARATYAGSTLIHQWMLAGLASLVMIVAGAGIALAHGNWNIAALSWALAGTLPFILLRDFVRRLAFAHLRMVAALALDSGVATMQLGGLLLVASEGFLSARTAYFVMGAACAAAALGAFASMRMPIALRREHTVPDLWRNWSFGKWMFVGQATALLTSYSIPWLLVAFHSTRETARFSVCMSIVMAANPIALAMANIIGPKASQAFAQGGMLSLRRVARKATLVLASTIGAISSVMVLFGGKIVVVLYGNAYAGNGRVIAVLALSWIIFSLGTGADTGLWAMGRPEANFVANLLGLVTTFIVAVATIRHFEVLGAAVAALAGTGAAVAAKQISFVRYSSNVEIHHP